MSDVTTPIPRQTDESVVYRPLRLRITAAVFSILLVGLCAAGWVMLPSHLRGGFTLLQRGTLILILATLVGVMVALALSSVRADADGLHFRNALRTHQVPWARVHKILLRPGDSWALLLLKPADGGTFEVDLDAEKRHLMGIQKNDGQRAARAVADLRARHQRAIRSRET